MAAIFTPFVDGVDDVNAEDVNSLQRFGAEISPAPGRLTLETGVPISTTDQSAKATLYYTLTGRHGNKVRLYNTSASRWDVYTMSADLSLSLASLTASTAYDIYVYSNAGTLTLEAAAWSGSTPPTRAIQGGWYVKSADKSRLLLGSIYINSSGGQTDDTINKRFVCNLYNTSRRRVMSYNTTASWNYSTAAYREFNGGTGQVRGEFVLCASTRSFSTDILPYSTTGTFSANIGGALNLTSSGNLALYSIVNNALIEIYNRPGNGISLPAGYSYITQVETVASGTMTFAGNNLSRGFSVVLEI